MSEITSCPICLERLQKPASLHSTGLTLTCDCLACGKFEVPALVASGGLDADVFGRAAISFGIRRMPGEGVRVVTLRQISRFAAEGLPGLTEQANNFIVWLGKKQRYPGVPVSISANELRGIIGAASVTNVQLVIHHLKTTGMVDSSSGLQDVPNTNTARRIYEPKLTFAGWELYERLLRQTGTTRLAFMALKFGEPALDRVIEDAFVPAVRQTGFDLRTLQKGQPAGLIDDHMRVAIRTARFVIADLTHNSFGAYWEAGFAEGLGKPVIYTCEEKIFHERKTHFDTNHMLTVAWDADHLESAAEELKATIRATLPAEAKMTDD